MDDLVQYDYLKILTKSSRKTLFISLQNMEENYNRSINFHNNFQYKTDPILRILGGVFKRKPVTWKTEKETGKNQDEC